MTEHETQQCYDRIFVARQPIFTAQMNIWGYELLFRHGETQAAVFTDGDQATTQVIADGFALGTRGINGKIKALINFPRNVLVGAAPYVLPADRSVVEILETVLPEDEVMEACRELKNQGYTLALDDFVGEPGFEPLCEIADIVKVDILGKSPVEVLAIVKGLRGYKARLLAEKVENLDMFNVCKKLGFELFQGYFFSKPEIVPGRKLSASQTTKIKLLKELNESEAELSRLVEIIQTDLSISYRLLKYINSARFSLRGKIESIPRAVNMLGRQNLRQWLQVVILSDINSTDKGQELLRISVLRGRFLQLLAAVHPAPFHPDSMFVLGFFSVLDAILDQHMDQVLDEISLDPDIKGALIDPHGPNSAWLELLKELDRGRWTDLEQKATQMSIPMNLIDSVAIEAAMWTDEVMGCAS
ncbi:MAG: HDOD domain-containing protein [Desulfomicrobium sp.]|nr:HDOD domain-containing protein [Pseudomonadota bacterium]MBV1712860.1 HDOD domain-containing protein [Desulfomicrobium sp.]MBU4571830.1 HDOD domain-containing protein [Pseudomonadota bacterium]MBU4595979.1 HDOD domain-containing protein [Pseudomonadota bacterium]MBV1721283.1 HDOD domain-containing protein [Desulfomicrobium sp.]